MNAISILELKAAGHENLSQFPERIRQHYYDRLYLTVEHWYPPEFIAEIDKYYRVQTVVKQPPCSNHLETGRYTLVIGDRGLPDPGPAPTLTPARGLAKLCRLAFNCRLQYLFPKGI